MSELKHQIVNLHQQLLEKQVGYNCVCEFARVYWSLDKFTGCDSLLRASFIRIDHVQSV